MNPTRDLPKWLWLYLPFAILPVQLVTRLGSDEVYKTWMRSEISVPELGTVFCLLVAVVAGVTMLARWRDMPQRLLVGWIALFTLGCFYFCGEEASWGQHYLHWQTPEWFAEVNDQQETGLHNLHGFVGALLDQLPRNVLTLGAIACVVIVVWRRRRPARFAVDSRWHWIWPTYVVVPAALLALTIGLPRDFLGKSVPHLLEMQPGEFKEYFLAMMLMMYSLSLRMRLRAATNTNGS